MATKQVLSADDVIRLLDLQPHPEGGFYRETFRDRTSLPGSDRAASTAIYFLLRAGEISRWHSVDATEIWHWHCGAPVALSIAGANGPRAIVMLGADLAAGQRPQGIVPAGQWQQAQCLSGEPGEWSLVGCTVAPGFEFSAFRLADAAFDPPARI